MENIWIENTYILILILMLILILFKNRRILYRLGLVLQHLDLPSSELFVTCLCSSF